MSYPDDRRYTKEHEWVKLDGDVATVGITDFAQHELGDIVFVELPNLGKQLEQHQPFGSIESVKAVSEIYAPMAGEVVEVNGELSAAPENVNKDPHGSAWLLKLRASRPDSFDALLTADQYAGYIQEKASS